jgi:hypothetical protein
MSKKPTARAGTLTALAFLAPVTLLGCTMPVESDELDSGDVAEFNLVGDTFNNGTGTHRTRTVNGAVADENNPFFQSLGTNGRACVNCHQPAAAMGITPPQVRAVFDATQGLDPLERRCQRTERTGRDARPTSPGLQPAAQQGSHPHSDHPSGQSRFRREGRVEPVCQHGCESSAEHRDRPGRDARALVLPKAAALGEHALHLCRHVGRTRSHGESGAVEPA